MSRRAPPGKAPADPARPNARGERIARRAGTSANGTRASRPQLARLAAEAEAPAKPMIEATEPATLWNRVKGASVT